MNRLIGRNLDIAQPYKLFASKNIICFDKLTIDCSAFLKGRKLNISLVFLSQSYFKVPKSITLNVTHYFILKTLNKRELQQMASNHSSENDLKDLMKLCKDYSKDRYSFIVNDTTLSSDNPLQYMENLL